jgi:hypothetical protein
MHQTRTQLMCFYLENRANYCMKWCPFSSKTTLIIVINDANYMLKQCYILSATGIFLELHSCALAVYLVQPPPYHCPRTSHHYLRIAQLKTLKMHDFSFVYDPSSIIMLSSCAIHIPCHQTKRSSSGYM